MLHSHPSGDLAQATWIDLLSPTAEDIAQVHAATSLRVPGENEISEIESSSRLAFSEGSYYLSAPFLTRRQDGEPVLAPVGFVLSSRVLITVRYTEIPTFDDAREQCRQERALTAEEAFLHLVEAAVDRSADALEQAGAECDALSRNAFRQRDPKNESQGLRAALTRIGNVADRASRLRDSLLGLGRIAAYLMESEFPNAPKVSTARIRTIRSDIVSLTDYQSHLEGKAQFLLDATLGFINIEQNEIVKTLTIASVVGIPPVLIGGIYGMNFRVLPELQWQYGYPFALGLMLVTGLLPLLWFKRRGWM